MVSEIWNIHLPDVSQEFKIELQVASISLVVTQKFKIVLQLVYTITLVPRFLINQKFKNLVKSYIIKSVVLFQILIL